MGPELTELKHQDTEKIFKVTQGNKETMNLRRLGEIQKELEKYAKVEIQLWGDYTDIKAQALEDYKKALSPHRAELKKNKAAIEAKYV